MEATTPAAAASATTAGGDEHLTIAYWNIRGLCAPLRMVAFWTGAVEKGQVTFTCYDAGDPASPDYKASWFASAKESLKASNPMINLPYVQVHGADGGLEVTITQTNACLYALGRRWGG